MPDVRPWTHAAVFGALWGAVESTAGPVLKTVEFVPTGIVMGLVAILCCVTARRLQPAVGVTLVAGLVSAALVAFTTGGARIGPLIGIVSQALILEVFLTLLGPGAVGAALGGGLALAVGPVQKVAMILVVAGPEALRAYRQGIDGVFAWFGWPPPALWAIALALVVPRIVVGVAMGLWASRIAGRVSQRLGSAE